MKTMGKVDTSDLMIITSAKDISFQSPILKWATWTHSSYLSIPIIYPGKSVFCFSLLCSLMICTNDRAHYETMVIFVCLLITFISLSSLCRSTWRYWTLKCVSDIFCLECDSKIKCILSIIFHAIYLAVLIQLTHFAYDGCENTCTLSYHHHQIGCMTHLPLFRVRSWKNGITCMSFYILTSGQKMIRAMYLEAHSYEVHMKLFFHNIKFVWNT